MNHNLKRVLMVGPAIIFVGGLVAGCIAVPLVAPVMGGVIAFAAWSVWAGTKLIDGEWYE